jgi:hypothetical protein
MGARGFVVLAEQMLTCAVLITPLRIDQLDAPPLTSALSSSCTTTSSIHPSSMKAHIASICFKCFKCFRDMLHVFQMDVAKIDWDVAYVAMVVQVCYKGLFLMFYLCFQTYVASVFI